jgi:hypothetical protein
MLRHFQPAVICFCEVGEVSSPLSEQHFNDLKYITSQAWISFGAAAEHVEFFQTPGKPYLTAYRTDHVTCEHYSMLSNLYDAQRSERTAQHFLVTPAGTGAEESINVINVHAPSGTKKLTATQRTELVGSLLQSTSLIDATKSVGNDRYIIGGDLNTGEQVLADIMGVLVRSGACASSWRAFRQLHGNHGDMGFCNGVRGHVLRTLVHGHDPQHYPYAFRALSKQTLPPAAAEHRARPAAAEDFASQPTPADSAAAPAAGQRQPPLESCASSEELHPETSTAASAAAEAMTQPANAPTSSSAPAEQVATMPAQEPSQQALPPAAAEHWDRPAAAADVATLQRQATQRMNAALPTSIIHAFLHYLPLRDDHAATRVTEILEDETRLSDDDLAAIARVFEPAFIWYKDPRHRTEFVHRDTLSYVRAWQKLASHRSAVGKTAYFDGTILTPAQRQTCFQAYLRDFGSTPLLPGQQKSRMKSYAEAHLRDIAANRLIAWVIWEVGVPRIAPAAEQRDTHPQEGAPAAEQRADPLEENIIAILGWLDGAARSITQYQQTATYQEAVRRAGPSRGVSGLTQAEQAQRAQLRRAHADVRRGRKLAELWDRRLITYETVADADWAVLQKHLDGSDVRHLEEIQQQRADRRIAMPELWTHPPT